MKTRWNKEVKTSAKANIWLLQFTACLHWRSHKGPVPSPNSGWDWGHGLCANWVVGEGLGSTKEVKSTGAWHKDMTMFFARHEIFHLKPENVNVPLCFPPTPTFRNPGYATARPSIKIFTNLQMVLPFERLWTHRTRIFPLFAVDQLVLRQRAGVVEVLAADRTLYYAVCGRRVAGTSTSKFRGSSLAPVAHATLTGAVRGCQQQVHPLFREP